MLDHNDQYRTVTASEIHDLRNRLTVVKGIAQLLVRQVRRADWQRDQLAERVGILHDEILRLELMLNDVGRSRERGSLSSPASHMVYSDD